MEYISGLLLLVMVLGLSFFGVYQYGRYQEISRIKQIISRQRHDWMNHVQVLMGYLKLKKIERIEPYLENLMQEVHHERKISEISYLPLSIFLLTLHVQYPQWRWQVRCNDSVPVHDKKWAKRVYRCLSLWLSLISERDEAENNWERIEIYLSAETLHINIWQHDQTPYSFSKKVWKPLTRKIDGRYGKILLEDNSTRLTICLHT